MPGRPLSVPSTASGLCAAFLVLLALGAPTMLLGDCSEKNDGGAVLVRWRFSLANTGVSRTDCDLREPRLDINVTITTLLVVVRALPEPEVDASAVDAGASVDMAESPPLYFQFRCGPNEGTTPFSIPPGRYAIALEARSCGVLRRVGYSPPPQVRDVRLGEITNVGAIQILIPNCEKTRCDLPPDQVSTCDGGIDGT